jgi:hypothetical protein
MEERREGGWRNSGGMGVGGLVEGKEEERRGGGLRKWE